jgi:hypothetical protein
VLSIDMVQQALANTEIPGLFSTDGYVSIGHRTPDDIANLILERLGDK